MINPKELRIGNWVQTITDKNKFQIRDGEDIDDLGNTDTYEPIPLTPEILKLCGFKQEIYESLETVMIGEAGQEHKQIFKHIEWFHSKTSISLGSLADYKIVFLNTLQNCWFFKTGNELEVNLNHTTPSQLH